jgi:hypothetical protein
MFVAKRLGKVSVLTFDLASRRADAAFKGVTEGTVQAIQSSQEHRASILPCLISRFRLRDLHVPVLIRIQAKQHLPPGIDLVKADDFQEWQMDIRVLDANPLYQDQIYRLSFTFGKNYPIGMLRPLHPWISIHE